jgi:hypothetical protein
MLFRLVSIIQSLNSSTLTVNQCMDTKSAILEYKRLSPEIFKQGISRYLGSNIAKSAIGKSWFNGEVLEQAVKRIIREQLPDDETERLGADASDAPLLQDAEVRRENTCKTYKIYTPLWNTLVAHINLDLLVLCERATMVLYAFGAIYFLTEGNQISVIVKSGK